jgi:hypothetical protein
MYCFVLITVIGRALCDYSDAALALARSLQNGSRRKTLTTTIAQG